jgi:hypothetical protein
MEARLVVLGLDHPYGKEPGNPAEAAAKAILESRGNTPRLCRNSLVFLAVDKTRFQDLDGAARRYLAWASIVSEKDTLNLDPRQLKQAEAQKASADDAVTARLPEAYQWLLVPAQSTPQQGMEWQSFRLSGADALAVRASRKLTSDELLVTRLAGTRLRMELDRIPLWRGDHVAVKQLAEDFASYVYLPRLADASVVLGAVSDGVGLLTWEQDTFAYADSYDETAGRYRGLRSGQNIALVDAGNAGLVVKPEVARRQLSAEIKVELGPPQKGPVSGPQKTDTGSLVQVPSPVHTPKRFHGTVVLDSTRVGRDAGRIADEVISHLTGLVGAEVTITLEIEARVPSGVPENVVRTVTENSKTLKFGSQGFEKE